MARKQTPSTRIAEVQALVLTRVTGARKRITTFEKQLVKRGRAQEKRFNALLKRVRVGTQLRLIERQAVAAKSEVQRRFSDLQTRVIDLLGVASRSEIVQMNRALSRISRRVDALAKRPQAAA